MFVGSDPERLTPVAVVGKATVTESSAVVPKPLRAAYTHGVLLSEVVQRNAFVVKGVVAFVLVPSKMVIMPASAAASAAVCAICRCEYMFAPSIPRPIAPIAKMLNATITRINACPRSPLLQYLI